MATKVEDLFDLKDNKCKETQEVLNFFRQFQIFTEFEDQQGAQFIIRILQQMILKTYQPQDVIIEILRPVNSLFIFLNGNIMKNTSKKDKNQIEIIEPQAIGEEYFFSRQASKYNFIALKESQVCQIYKDDFFRFVKKKKLTKSLIYNVLSFSQFSDISANFIEQIIQRSNTQYFIKNQIVYDKNDESKSWYIILEGEFQVLFQNQQQFKPLIILSKGNCFGELEIIEKSKRIFRVQCQTTQSEVLEIQNSQFLYLISKNQQFNKMIIESIFNKKRQYVLMEQNNKINLNLQLSTSPQRSKFAFKGSNVRIKSLKKLDDQTINELYQARQQELKNLLNYRAQLIEKESSQSVLEKIQSKNPRLRQFLDKIDKARSQKQKQSEQKKNLSFLPKTHRKVYTETALTQIDTQNQYISTIHTPASSRTHLQNISPKINSKFYKLLFN